MNRISGLDVATIELRCIARQSQTCLNNSSVTPQKNHFYDLKWVKEGEKEGENQEVDSAPVLKVQTPNMDPLNEIHSSTLSALCKIAIKAESKWKNNFQTAPLSSLTCIMHITDM